MNQDDRKARMAFAALLIDFGANTVVFPASTDERYKLLEAHGYTWDEKRGLWNKAETKKIARPSARDWWLK